jgi:hypothetical protein
VIDDWALAPLSELEHRDFWQICEDRDPTLVDGILGPLVHNAHRIEMRGDFDA